MFVKLSFPEKMELLDLARFCGVAPCSIVAANSVHNETELGKDLVVPVATAAMVRDISDFSLPDETEEEIPALG